jgi:hypothetical protein
MTEQATGSAAAHKPSLPATGASSPVPRVAAPEQADPAPMIKRAVQKAADVLLTDTFMVAGRRAMLLD